MAGLLADIHAVRPESPFREFQSWAWEAKWQVPPWTRHADSWRAAFELLAGEAPAYEPTFLHRDFSHRNLLWDGPEIGGVVDWVETSTGPRWLDAAHAATNLAVAFGADPARAFLAAYAGHTDEPLDRHWLVMDAVGFLLHRGSSRCSASPSSCGGSTTGCTRWCTAAAGPDGQPTSRTRRRNCLVRSSCGSVSTSAPPRSAMTPWSRKSTWSATSRAKRISWVTITSVQPGLREVADDGQHLADQLGVEGGGGLVEQHDLRVEGERAGDADTLLLTARELGRVRGPRGRSARPARAADGRRRSASADVAALHLDRSLEQVLEHRLVREQVVGLEDHAAARAQRRDLAAARALSAGAPKSTEASAMRTVPASGVSSTLSDRRIVVLPDPDGSDERGGGAFGGGQVDALEHVVVAEGLLADRGPR